MPTSLPVTSPSESSRRSKPAPASLSDLWGQLTYGAQQLVAAGVVSRVHVAILVLNVFLYSFLEIDSNFKNLYLELGVSKWREPNFVGFTLKCTIL